MKAALCENMHSMHLLQPPNGFHWSHQDAAWGWLKTGTRPCIKKIEVIRLTKNDDHAKRYLKGQEMGLTCSKDEIGMIAPKMEQLEKKVAPTQKSFIGTAVAAEQFHGWFHVAQKTTDKLFADVQQGDVWRKSAELNAWSQSLHSKIANLRTTTSEPDKTNKVYMNLSFLFIDLLFSCVNWISVINANP